MDNLVIAMWASKADDIGVGIRKSPWYQGVIPKL
jgi:hypothetical protein